MKVSGLAVETVRIEVLDVTQMGDTKPRRIYGDMSAHLAGIVEFGRMEATVRLTGEESMAIAEILARVVARYEASS